MKSTVAIVFVVLVALCSTMFAAPVTVRENFASSDIPDGFNIKGDVSVDRKMNKPKSRGGALKVSPGASVSIPLAEDNSTGKIDIWVYDDMKTPKDPSQYNTGPRWGLKQADGRILAVGCFYTGYLDGDKTYVASYFSGSSWYGQLFRLKGVGRKKGWRKWTFKMHGRRGLSISVDDKDVNARYKNFKWDDTQFLGITELVILGDSAKNNGQTIWVDDIFAGVSSESKARPASYEEMVPKKDPKERKPAKVTELMSKNIHPRLLFTAEDIPAMKAYANGRGKQWMEKLNQYAYACNPPQSIEDVKFLKNATDGQRYGLWQMPTVTLQYVLTGNQSSFDKVVGYMKILLELEHWETSSELDSGMSAGNVMIGAGFAFDCLYNELEPEFREKFRQKLIYHARAQYYGGHLKRAPNRVHYWQGDPQNNHRWHRNAGMASCILAAYDGSEDQQWILKRVYEELKFIDTWLPKDGTCHESASYMIFGGSHLLVGMQAAEHCFEDEFLNNPFYANQARFRMHTLIPGLKKVFEFGDSGGHGSYNPYLLKGASDAGLSDVYDGILKMAEAVPNSFSWGWQALVWGYEPIAKGNMNKIEKSAFFPDMGMLFVRDGWQENNAAALFKCGPYGGYDLNRYRNENDYQYINVAHDDPDANMIQFAVEGQIIAENDRYGHHKFTQNHNTVLVNGSGQKMEANGFLQPYGGNGSQRDMTKSAVVTGLLIDGEISIVEGEAAGSYPEIKSGQKWGGKVVSARPALDRYRRAVIWVEGKYMLVLDDIQAAQKADLTWLMQSGEVEGLGQNRFRLKKQANANDDSSRPEFVQRDFQIATTTNFSTKIVDSTADHRGKPVGWRQLQATAKTKSWQLATVFNIWDVNGLGVSIKEVSSGKMEVSVSGRGISDKWTWNQASGKFTPSTITGQLGSGKVVRFDKSCKPPLH